MLSHPSNNNIRAVFIESIKVKEVILKNNSIDRLIQIGEICKNAIMAGKKIMFCGNGGSAADAQHLAAEYLVRLRPNVNRKPLPAISLAQDTSTLTACGNDFGFNDIFLRPFQALASKHDVLICITTSGNSKNIIKVLKEAKKKKISSICFLGNNGGQAKKLGNINIIVNSKTTACKIFLLSFMKATFC